jgi:hypothetical protein
MTVSELQKGLALEIVTLPDPEREITGGYTGDLLSFVMGSARSGDAWVTIMSNVNVIAVATLTDVAVVLLASGVALDPGVKEKAEAQQINVLSSPLSSFDLCASVARYLK